MFGIGPTELAFFLVIVLLAVGPERLPAFMRTVGKGVRQARNASREFKDAIGFDDLMREGDPFRAPPIRPPVARPVSKQDKVTSPPSSPEAVPATSPNVAPAPSEKVAPAANPDAASPGADPEPEADGPSGAKRP